MGLECLIEHVLAGGVHGLFILGTTGEGPSLSQRLREEMIRRTCRQVQQRVSVLVGITDTAGVETRRVADIAADAGADAVVAAPPYYYPISQPELLEYVERLAPRLPLPLFLYNMPTHTKTFFEIDTVRRALEIPNVVGIKDSSGNMDYFRKLAALVTGRAELSVMMGPEELLAESVLAGGQGGVCGGANLCPGLYVDLYEAARARDTQRTADLHAKVMRISTTLYRIGHHGPAFIKAIKCALHELGLCDDFMAEPFQRFGDAEHAVVREVLAASRITLQSPAPHWEDSRGRHDPPDAYPCR